MRDRSARTVAFAVLGSVLHAVSGMVARPALRLGGEWAGHKVAYATSGAVSQSKADALISEQWEKSPTEGGGSVLHRRTISLVDQAKAEISQAVLPRACSDANVLQPGNAMFEPEILNARAWALDTTDEAADAWVCETVFDGLGGPRPAEYEDSVECPAERTRVRCVFDPTTGMLAPTDGVTIWQERCWSAAPAEDLEERARAPEGLDSEWTSSLVGYSQFEGGDERASAPSRGVQEDSTLALKLAGGVEMHGKPGMLEITLKSGAASRQQWSRLVVRRSWVGGADAMSVFAEVEAFDETQGDD